jgi:hypothetical protein
MERSGWRSMATVAGWVDYEVEVWPDLDALEEAEAAEAEAAYWRSRRRSAARAAAAGTARRFALRRDDRELAAAGYWSALGAA